MILVNKKLMIFTLISILVMSNLSDAFSGTLQVRNGEASMVRTLNLIGMDNSNGQFCISNTGDTLNGVATLISQLTNDTGFITSSALASYITGSSLSSTLAAYATTSSLSGYVPTTLTINGHALSGNITLSPSDIGSPSGSGTSTGGNTGDQIIPSVLRTTSSLTLSLVGAGATGTQISSTKDSTIRCSVSTSTTSTIGGPSTSVIALKICATNNATEGSWTTVGTLESDQTITLAVVLQSIQIVKGQLCTDVPASWFAKLVNSGTGTHAETYLSGQQTVYG